MFKTLCINCLRICVLVIATCEQCDADQPFPANGLKPSNFLFETIEAGGLTALNVMQNSSAYLFLLISLSSLLNL